MLWITELIHDFPDWLVEMDIVKSPVVEELRQAGIDEQFNVGGDDSQNRKKKAAFNAENHNYLYWPNARVPYAFHPNIGMHW